MDINKIIVVGGGSAGWMTAATLIKAFPEKDITLIESPDVPTVGVGESTISQIRGWTTFLGIDDTEFLKHTDGIFKLSIKFTDFYRKGEQFHYPFGPVDLENTRAGLNDWWFKKEFYPETPNSDYADCYCPNMALVNKNKLSYNEDGDLPLFDFKRDTAYHFDATKFGLWLKEHYCLPRGVKYIQEDIIDVPTDENGIKCVVTKNYSYHADLFIDCTGFKSLLLSKFDVPFESLSNKLPNNKAWATRIPYTNKEEELKPYTNCTAIENGWVWNIPLWNRIGTGYVYSDKYVSDEQALEEFKKHLNRDDVEELKFKNITMRTGIHSKLFVKNVAAVGLSAGFIEPLESNGLFTVHEFLLELIRNLRRDKVNQWDKDNYTSACKRIFYQFAEFVGLHYALTQRDDTPYWRENNERVYDENLYTLKGNFMKGYLYAAISRFADYEFSNDGGGLHFIAAGMNWAPTDLFSLQFRNQMNKEQLYEMYKPSIDNLEYNKNHWNYIVERYKSNIDFLKENIYNEDSTT